MFEFLKPKPAALTVASALKAAHVPFLNLGCGARFHKDWVNLDIAPTEPERVISHNLLEPLPFADGTFSAVYHSHVLEHLPKAAADSLIAECRRTLHPGGTLRVVVPDLETIAKLYLDYLSGAWAGDKAAIERHEWMTLEVLDQLTREQSGGEMLKHWKQQPMPAESFVLERMGGEVRGVLEMLRKPVSRAPRPAPQTPEEVGRFRAGGEVHKWMYDRVSLKALLLRHRFSNIAVCSATESSIPGWASFQLDCDPEGNPRKPDSLFVEATAIA